MRSADMGFFLLVCASVSACVPVPVATAPQPEGVVATPALAPPPDTAAAGPDLSPVSEPTDLLGIARWRSPAATAANLASCAGVPAIVVEVNTRMAVDQMLREVLRGSIDTRKLAALVALDAPVDMVVTVDPQEKPRPPWRAVAVGLTSLDGARIAIAPEGQTAPETSPGVWRIRGDRGGACAVAASAGATPARLICAEREATLTALAPYMARTVPGLDIGGPDLRVEAHLDVLRKRYGEYGLRVLGALPGSIQAEYGTGSPVFDTLLLEAAQAMQVDAQLLLGDLHRVTAEVRSASSGTCLHASADLTLASKTAWVAETLTDRLDRSGPPPALYWRQPRDSELALYSRGVDPGRFPVVLQKARALLEAAMASENIGAAADRRKVAAALIDLPLGKDTDSVLSHGSVAVPLPEATTPAGQQKVIEGTVSRLLGWTLVGVGEGPAAIKKQLKAMVDAYNLPSLQAAMKREAGSDAKSLPVVKSVKAAAALGAGAEALEISIPNLKMPPPPDGHSARGNMSLTLHLMMMPDGDATWLAFGGAKSELVKRLSMVKKSANDKDQLASREGMEPLKTGKQMLGGFLSVAPVGNKIAAFFQAQALIEPQWAAASDASLAQSLLALPNRGQTPLFVTANGTPGAGTATTLSLSIDVQQGTLQDAKSLMIANYGLFSKMGLLP